jgi:pimeloyl-ACP methyl ester carboxylesterase
VAVTDPVALPPVVLLHGWGGSARSAWTRSGWERELAARGRDVVAIDLPGHGAAEAPRDPGYYAGLVELVEARLPEGTPLDVVGFSLGGKLAILLALRDPARFRRLVVAGVGENLFSREQGGLLGEALRDGIVAGTARPIREMVVYVWQSDNDPEAVMACLMRPWTPPTPEAVSGLSVPVLLVAGDEDSVVGSTPYAREFRDSALAFIGSTSSVPVH